MKYYKLSFVRSFESDEPGFSVIEADTVWVGTQKDAAAQRAEWVKRGVKHAEINTEEVDVPTDRKGLLDFLRRSGAR